MHSYFILKRHYQNLFLVPQGELKSLKEDGIKAIFSKSASYSKERKFVSKTNKNPAQKPLNNISKQRISTFIKEQDIIIDCFKKVA